MSRVPSKTVVGVAAVVVASTAIVATIAPSHAVINPTTITPLVMAEHSPGGLPSVPNGPSFDWFTSAKNYAKHHPGTAPQGINNFSCRPADGQHPVILIPGTGEDAFSTYSSLAPRLAKQGYCVYSFNVNPRTGENQESRAFSGDIRASAQFLAGFVDKVLVSTKAQFVDLAGHSQGGGPLPMYYLKRVGGASKVHQLIGISPSNHGTTVSGLNTLIDSLGESTHLAIAAKAKAENREAYLQQVADSPFMQDLYADGDQVGGVEMTVIATRVDVTMTPYSRGFLAGAKNNFTVQDFCPLSLPSHDRMPYDVVVQQLVMQTLDPASVPQITC